MTDTKHLEGLKTKAEKASVSDAPVSDFMSKSPVLIQEGTRIYTAIQILTTHHVGSAPVVDRQNKIVGVISEHDLLLQTATRDVKEPIQYTENPIVVAPETPLKDALVLLYKKKVRRIPVVSSNRVVIGTVTRMDVLLKLIGKG